ncbi:PAQR family membrane homeostasis protein TrhA [Reyranella sp.]|uniref:PAQR family membrane homeostasis protein TrhA n=1 Tax=Reyranella sp. TaxID=1929291 RepID=UPI002F93BEED
MTEEIGGIPRLPSTRELVADGVVHALGVGLGLPAAIALVVLATLNDRSGSVGPIAIYATGLVAMFVCSAAYNIFGKSRLRAWLQRFDHAAIFAMIGGTYTPFTVLRLESVWSAVLTSVIWAAAALGILAKLLQPRWIEPVSVALYLGLGWIGLVAIGPLMKAMDTTTLALLGAGGLIYTIGVVFHLWRALPFQNAIWHGFVLVGAALHYGAVLSMMD